MWATTVEVNNIPDWAYLILLSIVLGYDIPWCILRTGVSQIGVRFWAFINFATLVISTLTYLACYFLFLPFQADIAEEAALFWVVVASVFDLWGVLTDRPLIPKIFAHLIPSSDSH
jgi:hypothetical protein